MPGPNALFESLGGATKARLNPYCETIPLTKGDVLCESGDVLRHAYFPLDGLIVLLAVTDDGRGLGVATVGSDGMAGVSLALNGHISPYQIVVQTAGSAHRVRAPTFVRECQRCEDLLATSLDYADLELRQMVLWAACHHFHSLAQRVSRWLLLSCDASRDNTIELTQDLIAHMLGVSRPKVSDALGGLDARQLIIQGHGRIHIINQKGLEQACCSCYRANKRGLNR